MKSYLETIKSTLDVFGQKIADTEYLTNEEVCLPCKCDLAILQAECAVLSAKIDKYLTLSECACE